MVDTSGKRPPRLDNLGGRLREARLPCMCQSGSLYLLATFLSICLLGASESKQVAGSLNVEMSTKVSE